MAASQYFADAILNWLRGTTFPAAPVTNVFLSLHSGDPGALGVNNDVTTTIASGRATLALANLTTPAAGSPSGRVISNVSAVNFTNSALADATLTYFGVWSAISAGNFLVSGILSPPANILTGDIVEFAAGQMKIRIPYTT